MKLPELRNGLRLERVIGEGAMGVVYEARDTSGRRVAVKLMSEHFATDPGQRRRFEREARALAKLSSPHVVRVLDVGVANDGTPFYAMELLEGRSLMAFVEKEGPLPFARAVALVREALDAIGEAHAAGLVHRDIKPDNLFLTNEGIVKVLDLGIVKDLASRTAPQTKTGDAMGTPAYMAPEQVRAGEPVDARTDVWAVGATLYELVTGDIPFRGTSVAKILQRILDEPPAPIGRPDVPAELEAVIRKCLAKNKDDRYASARDLDLALAPFAPAAAPAAAPRRKAAGAGRRRPAPATTPPPRTGARAFAIAFGVVSVLAAIGLGLLVRARRPVSPPITPVTATSSATPPLTTEPAPPPTGSVAVEAPERPDASAPPRPPRVAPSPSKAVSFPTRMTLQSEQGMAHVRVWLARHRGELAACAPSLDCEARIGITLTSTETRVDSTFAAILLPGRPKPPEWMNCGPTDERNISLCVQRVLKASPPELSADCESSFTLVWDPVR